MPFKALYLLFIWRSKALQSFLRVLCGVCAVFWSLINLQSYSNQPGFHCLTHTSSDTQHFVLFFFYKHRPVFCLNVFQALILSKKNCFLPPLLILWTRISCQLFSSWLSGYESVCLLATCGWRVCLIWNSFHKNFLKHLSHVFVTINILLKVFASSCWLDLCSGWRWGEPGN